MTAEFDEQYRDALREQLLREQSAKEAATTLARWQGDTDRYVTENTRRLDGINGSIASTALSVAQMREDLSVMRTKIGFYSAIGSLGGTGIVSLILLVLSK